MPKVGTFLYPTKTVDGNVKAVGISTWAQETLSGPDYYRFLQAFKREWDIWTEAETAGNIASTSLDPVTGKQTITFHNDIVSDPEYVTFEQQYMADTGLSWSANNGVMTDTIS